MSIKHSYTMTEKLTLWPTDTGAWHFLRLPKAAGIEIKDRFGAQHRGFGSLPVEVTIGKTVWRTSIFPVKISQSYILPVKAAVRKAESLYEGESVTFSITIIP
jgi:hypothetical protein